MTRKQGSAAWLGLAVLLLTACSATQAAAPADEPVSLERAISRQLEQDPTVRQRFLAGLNVTGEFRCGVELLDTETDGTHYLEVLCGNFTSGQGMTRGGVLPAVVEVRGRQRVASVRFPPPKRLPEPVQDAVKDDELAPVPSQAELAGWG